MRGCSGSGKSTFAKLIAKELQSIIVSADYYFSDQYGNYNFDPMKLGAAHGKCFFNFQKAINNNDNVIVDNTNANVRDAQHYIEHAKDAGYNVCIIEMTCDLKTASERNIHEVPEQTIDRHLQRISTQAFANDIDVWQVDGTSANMKQLASALIQSIS